MSAVLAAVAIDAGDLSLGGGLLALVRPGADGVSLEPEEVEALIARVRA